MTWYGKILFSILTWAPLVIGQHLSCDLNTGFPLVHVSETLCIKPEPSPISHQKSTWLRVGCFQHLCSLQLLRPTACIQPLPFLSGCSIDLPGLEMRKLSTPGSSLLFNQEAMRTTMRLLQPELLVNLKFSFTNLPVLQCANWATNQYFSRKYDKTPNYY